MLSHPLRIVIATKGMTRYPTGGGHWSWLLQYLLGLRDLGHDVHLLEFMAPTGDAEFDARVPRIFRRRLAAAGAEGLGVLLRGVGWEAEDEALEATRPVGHSQTQVAELVRGADCLWNLCGALIGPLRDAFSHRVFIDVDPGVTQLSALEHDMGLVNHDALFTTGGNLGDAGCDVPDAGRRWHRFLPFVHLPSWPMAPAPPPKAPYTTVTTWWSDASFPWRGELLSTAKRDGFLPYAEVPRLAGRRVTLATHLRPDLDWSDDLKALGDGWDVVDPDLVARTPLRYRRFIARSRGEFSCCKPIYRVLRTGWLSDRTVAYLATGRPAICEETGIADHVPTGRGLLTFREHGEAVEAFREIERDYEDHSQAARRLAEEHFDARVQLRAIIDRL